MVDRAKPSTSSAVYDNVLGSYGDKEPVYDLVEIPEHFGPVSLIVDSAKVKAFAYSIDDYCPWYFRGSPFGRPIGHAGVLANDLLQLFTLMYDPSRVIGLHTEEELWFEHPVFVGERVTLEGAYIEKVQRRGQGYVVMEASARGEDGRLILRHRGSEIMRTVPGLVAGRRGADVVRQKVTATFRTDLPFVGRVDRDTPSGTPLRPLSLRLTQPQMSVFSRCGEYVRNVHNDLDRARAAGLERPIIQGQQLVCVFARLLTRVYGSAWFTTGRLHVKFLSPVYAGEVVTVHGVVAEPLAGSTAPGEVVTEVWLRNQGNEVAAVGWAHARPGPIEASTIGTHLRDAPDDAGSEPW